jgi:fibro-slime domain-containing protein
MNQTQTRSPRKRLLSLILAVILMIGLLPISAFATSASAQAGEDKAATQDSEFLRIFHLDCGRKYFTVSEIEGIIDQLAENHFTHLQLAFGNDGLRFLLDDMSVEVNGTTYASDKVTSAVKQGNTNLTSGSSGELSQSDMDAIIKYANTRGIQIIPLFNAPGHMYTAVNAMNTLGVGGKHIEVSSPNDARTSNWAVDPTDATAVAFAKALLQKYVTYFAGKGSTMFNIGADESGLSSSNYASYAEMVNGMNAIVKAAGMTTLAYNDGIYNTAYAASQTNVTFDSDIVICYWTAGANSATVEYLLEKGFNLLNNSDNWYYVLGDYLYKIWSSAQWGYNDALNGIKKTPVTQMKDGKDYANSKQLLGSILCVWCDAPGETYESVKVYNLIKAMAEYNPDYFTGKVKLSAFDDATGVSVAVAGAKGQKATVEVKKITSGFTFDTEAHVSYNVTPAVDGKAYTGEGTVTLPVPEGWATEDSRIHACIIDNGAVKLISGTLSGGRYTFQVPHFSEMGLVQLAKGAGSTENVTVAVGRTSKAYDLTGDNLPNDGTYPLGDVASYTVTTAASGWKAESKAATTIVTGKQYVIGNGSQYLKRSGSSITPTTNLDDATKWTISSSGTGYTIKSGSYYLSCSGSSWSGYSLSASTIPATWSWSANDGFYYSVSDWFGDTTNYYLTYSDGWTVLRQSSARGGGQPYTVTVVPGGKTVTFKGLNPGSTSVTLGDTTYSVTVVEKQNVEIPISIIDYRADGLLFDFQVGGKTYDYGLVHSHNNDGDVSSVNGGTLPGESYGTRIAGTTLENSGYDASDSYSGNYYLWGNKWSRSGMVESELGSNGMPVYTNATVARVAQELAAGNYNSDEMAGVVNDNDVIYNTFIASDTAPRKVTGTDATKMSYAFSARKTWDNITNAYDLAWYLLNTLYQADTNMTTVTGTDGADHAVPIYGMKVDAYDRLILTENNGVYSFDAANKKSNYDTESRSIYEDDTASSLQFYPIDGLGYDAILGDTTDKTDSPYEKDKNGNITATVRPEDPNGSYTLRGEAQFVYQDNLYFEFSGDDDVYMYVNGVLALDLGGAHGICTKRVNLKDVAAKCHLTPGEVATFTFFYMERNSDASNFKIETNMELVQRAINVEKKAYDTSYGAEYADGASISTTTDNPTTVAYDLILTNKGNTDMHQISFTDQDTQGGTAAFGYGVANPYVNDSNTATVTLGQLSTYLIYVTDGDKEVENTRKTLTTLNELSEEVGKVTLAPGQSLHVRFLTATFKVPNATIQDYTNTVHATAYTKGETHQPLEDDASHELYSYNANDTGRTYVVDFGLPLEIHSIFDATAQNNIGDVSYNPGKNNLKYGTVVVKPDRYNTTLTYTRTADKTIDGAETIVLDVQYTMGSNKVTLEKTLTIIPASNVYYEDSLAAFTDGSGAAKDAKWSIVGNNGNAATEKTGVYQALEELGKHSNVYGHDDAYNSSSMLSMGTAHKVTVTANMLAKWDDTTSAWPTAQFTFKGTGFDIISLTDNTSGAIVVDVYKGSKTEGSKPVHSYLVNNYYGYTYNQETQKWEVDKNAGANAIYQIPVMKVAGLDYDEYTAVIEVFYNSFFDMNYDENSGKNQYSFWLDAVRIYDPMGEYADYTKDNEGYPQYIKLRDTLADGTAKPDGTNKTVFIDGGSTADIMTTYANLGPNNEVYLMNGQAITFKLTGADVDKIASVQIGAKAPKGTANLNVNNTDIVSGGLSTATEMYYDITTQVRDGNYQVTITNATGNILSLTNLKITYSAKGSVSLGTLNTQEQESAVSLVRALFTAPVDTFSPETFQADWGRAVRAGKKATLTVKTSADVESITVDGQSITGYTTRTQRTGWGWWSPKVTYHVFTYTITAPAQTTDYAVCAVNAEGTASEAVTATLTVKPTTWWNWWF